MSIVQERNASREGRYYFFAINEASKVVSVHDDLMAAITAMAKFRARFRSCCAIRAGATGARLSVQDCEDYMLPGCRLTANEDPEKVWRRLAAA